MNIEKIQEALKVIMAMPEVTPAEAQGRLMLMMDKVDAGDPAAIECLAEIAGMACTCDDPEMIRRFVVHVCNNGPVA